jgi:hypothetical protein
VLSSEPDAVPRISVKMTEVARNRFGKAENGVTTALQCHLIMENEIQETIYFTGQASS